MRYVVYYRHRVHRIALDVHVEAKSHDDAYDIVKSTISSDYVVTAVYEEVQNDKV